MISHSWNTVDCDHGKEAAGLRFRILPTCSLRRRYRDLTRWRGVRPPRHRDHRHVRLIWLACLSLALPAMALGQTGGAVASSAPLPPAAQSALDKGLAAVKQQDWLVAIRYFGQARDRAPDAPAPLYNLGLAEAQLPGRELRAVAWFDAYLALDPSAANATAVRKEASDLEIRAKGEALKVIEILKVLAAQAPTSDYWAKIAGLEAKAGDMQEAADIVRTRPDDDSRSVAGYQVVLALTQRSNINDALIYAGRITNSTYKDFAYDAIFNAQLRAGLLTDAKALMSTHGGVFFRQNELGSLAEAEYRAGAVGDAAVTIAAIRAYIVKDTANNADNDIRDVELSSLAVTLYNSGQRPEAERLFRQIKADADGLTGKDKDGHRVYILKDLAIAENEIGRRAEALALMREANAARIVADNAHEDHQGLFGFDEQIWMVTLDNLQDYDGAQALLSQLRGADGAVYLANRQDQLAERRETAAAGVADLACAAAEAASKKTLATAGSSASQRAQAWSEYIKGCLNRPLYMTDINFTIAALARYAPRKNLGNGAEMTFDHTLKPADELLDRINEIGELEHL